MGLYVDDMGLKPFFRYNKSGDPGRWSMKSLSPVSTVIPGSKMEIKISVVRTSARSKVLGAYSDSAGALDTNQNSIMTSWEP